MALLACLIISGNQMEERYNVSLTDGLRRELVVTVVL
jgi:hypothetical protein